jgi:acyl-coenzyme A thioesterase PaaI-like protein
MNLARPGKLQRHKRLLEELRANPFLTDEELAKCLGVSIQTIRLDRMELDIAELRERMKTLASSLLHGEQFIQGYRVLGELVEAEPGKHTYSLLTISPEMVVSRTGVARPYFMVAQAHTAALQIFPEPDEVFTSSANVKFSRPVRVGEKLLASAELVESKENRHRIKVITRVGQEIVFRATFHIYMNPTQENKA